ncbi:DUF4136 domain-containing protein [Ferrimonas pelagia]|uniref:DUF4136 domain-containing protein n=1 Tax=Ferrimonas pelagia TaxID=1177826 RepID=A0ABP9FFD2_9GAMM
MLRLPHCFSMLLLLSLFGCASAPGNIDYDTDVDFSAIAQYQLAAPSEEQDPLMAKRIQDTLQAELSARGWQQTPDGVLLRYRSQTLIKPKSSNFSIGIGGGSYGSRGGISGGVSMPVGSDEEQVIHLRLDMVQQGRVIWRAEDEIKWPEREAPEKRNARLSDAVSQLLAQFPPSVQ